MSITQANGGPHVASNLVTLCGGHHQQLHDSRLILHGKAPHDLAFEWRDDPTRTTTRQAPFAGALSRFDADAPDGSVSHAEGNTGSPGHS